MKRIYITILIMIMVLIIAYACYYHAYHLLKTKHTSTGAMLVSGVNSCTKTLDGTNGMESNYYCQIMVDYIPNGNDKKVTAGPIEVNNVAPYAVGDRIILRYDPTNPSDVVQESSPIIWGWTLIGLGTLSLCTGGLFISGEI